jgi:hypothetical protein
LITHHHHPFYQRKRDWISLLNESVHTSDDVDIGDIYAVSRNFVVVIRYQDFLECVNEKFVNEAFLHCLIGKRSL